MSQNIVIENLIFELLSMVHVCDETAEKRPAGVILPIPAHTKFTKTTDWIVSVKSVDQSVDIPHILRASTFYVEELGPVRGFACEVAASPGVIDFIIRLPEKTEIRIEEH